MPRRLLSDRGLIALLLFAVALVCVAEAIAYWPGMMTWDSIRQYDQALSGEFDDWHPPAMEWLWRRFLPVVQGPPPMLLIQLGLYWGGVAAMIVSIIGQRRRRLAVMIAAGAMMPLFVVLMATIIKDSLMASLLVMASAILIAVPARGGWGWRVVALVLIVAAATLRFNALPACLPLAVALLPAGWRATPARFLGATIACALVIAAALPLANRAVGAESSGVGLSLVIFDLGGITERTGVDQFPPIPGVTNPVAVNHTCYKPIRWDSYSWWTAQPCPMGFDQVRAAFAKSGESPYRHWIAAIAAHPIAYAGHRLAHFNINSRFLVHDRIERPVGDTIPPNDWGFHLTPNPLLKMFDRAARWAGATPLGWPICWMALALGLLVVAPGLPSRRLIVPFALSGLLYGLGYLPASVAVELRYHLWTMIGTGLALAFVADDLMAGATLTRRRVLWASAPFVVVVVLCAAARVGWV